MSDKIVTVGMFFDQLAAEMAKIRLEGEGIRVMLTGDTTGGLFAGMGGSFGRIHLQVKEQDKPRAEVILDAFEKEQGDEDQGGEIGSTAIARRPRKARPDRPSHEDDDRIQNRHPDQQKDRKPPEVAITSEITPPMGADEEIDEELSVAVRSDDLANRAWLASVLALMLMGISCSFWMGTIFIYFPLQAYAIWLLIRLMTMSEELGPPGTWKMYGAMIANVASLALLLSFLNVIRG